MKNLKALKKSVFYISLPLSFIGFFFPVYAYSKGASTRAIGLVYSAFSLLAILMRPLVGRLIDKRGRKTGLILGSILYILTNLLFLLDKNSHYLLVARLIQALAASFYWLSVHTMVSDISDDSNRARNFGFMTESINKGGFLGIFIGFNLVYSNRYGNSLGLVFLIYMLAGLFSLYNTMTRLEESITPGKADKVVDSDRGIRQKEFNFFLIFMGTLSFISSLTGHIYLIYLRENITSNFQLISYVFLPGAILSLFLPNRLGQISDKYNKRNILLIGIFTSGILTILLPISRSYYYFMLINSLLAINGMFYGPARSALVVDIVGENQRGRSYGQYQLAMGLGGMLGPLLGSLVYEQLGNALVFYLEGLMLIGLAILSGLLFHFGAKVKEDKRTRDGRLVND